MVKKCNTADNSGCDIAPLVRDIDSLNDTNRMWIEQECADIVFANLAMTTEREIMWRFCRLVEICQTQKVTRQ